MHWNAANKTKKKEAGNKNCKNIIKVTAVVLMMGEREKL